MTKRKQKILTLVLIGAIAYALMIILFVLLFPTIMDTFFYTPEEPAKPEVTYSEFPIQIEYMAFGERIVIDDTLICEFKGVERKTWLEMINTGVSAVRLWDSRLEKAQEDHIDHIILLSDDQITIDYSLGSADYYMGDISIRTTYPSFRVFETQPSGEVTCTHIFSAEELKTYGIEVIDCLLAEPIKNSFS